MVDGFNCYRTSNATFRPTVAACISSTEHATWDTLIRDDPDKVCGAVTDKILWCKQQDWPLFLFGAISVSIDGSHCFGMAGKLLTSATRIHSFWVILQAIFYDVTLDPREHFYGGLGHQFEISFLTCANPGRYLNKTLRPILVDSWVYHRSARKTELIEKALEASIKAECRHVHSSFRPERYLTSRSQESGNGLCSTAPSTTVQEKYLTAAVKVESSWWGRPHIHTSDWWCKRN